MPRNTSYKHLLACIEDTVKKLQPHANRWLDTETTFDLFHSHNTNLTQSRKQFTSQLVKACEFSTEISTDMLFAKQDKDQQKRLRMFRIEEQDLDSETNTKRKRLETARFSKTIHFNTVKRSKISTNVVTPERPTRRTQQLVDKCISPLQDSCNHEKEGEMHFIPNGRDSIEDPLTLLARVASHQEVSTQQADQTHQTHNNIPNPPTSTSTSTTNNSTEPNISAFVEMTESLDFSVRPRPDPRSLTNPPIEVNEKKKTITASTKWAILVSTLELGYRKMSVKKKKILSQATIRYQSYLSGYSQPVRKPSTFLSWFQTYKIGTDKGVLEAIYQDRRGYCRQDKTYVGNLESLFPGFLHSCYRYATNVVGDDADNKTLAYYMNERAAIEFKHCEIRGKLKMTKHHFEVFFENFEGKIMEPTTKPHLTLEHISDRLKFAIKWKRKLRSVLAKGCVVCFLDEKWFYVTSRRKKMKYLPAHFTEDAATIFLHRPKQRSRSFPVKVMFMGMVSQPYPEYDFDGKIMLKRVSKRVQMKKSYNQRFSDSFHVNEMIKNGDWYK